MTYRRTGASLGASLCLLASLARAFEVNPLVHSLAPFEGERDTALTVRNTTAEELRVEIRVFELALGADGPERGPDADERLFTLPPAAAIPPGGSQVVRVQWLPAEPLERDASFIVAVEQVSGEAVASAPQAGVQMLLTFNTVVHVEAAGARPELRAEAATLDGGARLRFELVNEGRGNAYGERLSLTLADGRRSVPLTPAELSAQGVNLFLPPDARQAVELTAPSGRWRAPLEIEVEYAER